MRMIMAMLALVLIGGWCAVDADAAAEKKKVVFVAGTRSHGYGAHEHKAGCMLLAAQLEKAMPNFETVVVTDGYPKDASVFDGADAVVVFADGGGRHPLMQHIDEFEPIMKRGVGLVCLHYAVEIPKGSAGDALLRWMGGYFETHWSVNPHWKAEFELMPNHPIARGVQPFKIQDEWYYHMRFVEDDGLTPILSAMPPESTLRRGDGPHSNNPHVREAVLEKKLKQHVAWAYERPEDYGGGRGFGFTGAHFHWNWGHNNFRKLVLNAIVWTAKGEVPSEGVAIQPLTAIDLEKNQDFNKPGKWDSQKIQDQLNEWNGTDIELQEKAEEAKAGQ